MPCDGESAITTPGFVCFSSPRASSPRVLDMHRLSCKPDRYAPPGFKRCLVPAVDYTARLPAEVLEPVFALFAPPELGVLSLVCRRWRGVVRACPRLWSSISIGCPAWRPAFLGVVLSRTGHAPLDVEVMSAREEEALDLAAKTAEATTYLRALAPHMSHVARLRLQIVVPEDEDQDELRRLMRLDAPILRELALYPLTTGAPGSLLLASDMLGSLPGRLRKVTLGWNFDAQASFPLAFARVTDFTWFADALSSASLRALFSTCPELGRLTLKVNHYSRTPGAAQTPHLRELTVYQPFTRLLLEDLQHESIPTVTLTFTDTYAEFTDFREEPCASWTHFSRLAFDTLILRWNYAGPILDVTYRASGDLVRHAHVGSVRAVDVLRGQYAFDHSSLATLIVEDGCLPRNLGAPGLTTVVIELARPPWETRHLPLPRADCTLFGASAGAQLLAYPSLQEIELRALGAHAYELPASHLLAALGPRSGMRALSLSGAACLAGSVAELEELARRFARIEPQTAMVRIGPGHMGGWWQTYLARFSKS